MSELGDAATVYVDAKIVGMHDKKLPKSSFVGYVIEETGEHEEDEVAADESDDAEILAILFAIDRLKSRFRRMTIICDHQSVVSEANRESVRNPSPLLVRLREEIRKDQVELKAIQYNRAHGTLTEYVNKRAESPAD